MGQGYVGILETRDCAIWLRLSRLQRYADPGRSVHHYRGRFHIWTDALDSIDEGGFLKQHTFAQEMPQIFRRGKGVIDPQLGAQFYSNTTP